MRNRLKIILYLVATIGFNLAQAGSYEDFFRAVRRDDQRTVANLLNRGFDANTLDPAHRASA